MKKNPLFLFLTTLSLLFWASCSTLEAPAWPESVPEIRAGILQGYLETEEYPDSLSLLPPPPEEGSAAYEADLAISLDAEVFVGTKSESFSP